MDWGTAITAEMVEKKLSEGGYDAVTLIHNETSTGTMNPLKEIAAVVKKFPDVLLIVDVVSSFSAMKIPFDELGLDVMLAGTQKALGAAGGRGGLHGLGEGLRQGRDNQGPRLLLRFSRVQEEQGKRHDADDAEHLALLRAAEQAGGHLHRGHGGALCAAFGECAALPAQWADEARFWALPGKGLRVDHAHLLQEYEERRHSRSLTACSRRSTACVIDGGYGKIKGTSFRISHHGRRVDRETLPQLLGWIDEMHGRSRNGRARGK